jgi:cell division protein FtsB
MRFSNIVLLLLITLVGFGFLLSHTINLQEELTQTRSQLARMEAELQALIEEKALLTGQVSGLSNENDGLRARVEALEAERLALTDQIDILQRKLALVEVANPILIWPLSTSVGRVAALVGLPMVPLSLGAAYVMNYKRATQLPAIRRCGTGRTQTTFQGALTREEFHLIALRRRSGAAR